MRSARPALALCAALGLSALAATPARALCTYDGVFNVETTIEQEFADSRWVVRARVVGVTSHWSDDDEAEPWVLYRLEVLETFKGEPGARMSFFSTRNSGGFYLERPLGQSNEGDEYLLFLNPSEDAAAPDGAVFVNYSCGRSGLWSAWSASDRARLLALSAATA